MPRTPKVALVLVSFAALSCSAPAKADLCHFFPDAVFAMPRATGPASARMREYVRKISRVLGVPEVPIYKGNVPNAAATPQGILYNPSFMTALLRRAGERGVLSVLAHEVGHKVNRDDSFFSGLTHPWDKELRADYVSGFVLAKLGMSQTDATVALRSLSHGHGSASHPGTDMRIPAVEAGWRSARNGEHHAAPRQDELHASQGVPRAAEPPAARRPAARRPSRHVERVAARPRMQRARYVSVPCVHAAHRYDVVHEVVPTPYGWRQIAVRVPCEHAKHHADRQRVVAYEGAEPVDDDGVELERLPLVGIYELD